MNDILRSRPALDAYDLQTLRDLYTQAQQWARHYETLVVNIRVKVFAT